MVKGREVCPKDCPERDVSCHGSCEKYRAFEAARLREQMKPSTAYGWWTAGKAKAKARRKREEARKR